MQSSQLKFVVFKIADYYLALPAQSVLKIIHSPAAESTINTGLIHTDKYTIKLLNLHEKLATDQKLAQAIAYNFTIIVQSKNENLVAIPVEEAPDLIELASEDIRALPLSYPHQMLSKLSTHIGVTKQSTTVFILNINSIQSVFNEANNHNLLT